MSQRDWQPSLSFAERISVLMKIKTAYKSAYPETPSPALQQAASALETDAFNVAVSKDSYYQKAQKVVEELEPVVQGLVNMITIDDVISPENACGVQLSPYQNATYYREGLFSTVYKADGPKGQLIAVKLTTPSRMSAPHNSFREARILHQAANKHVIPLLSTNRQPDGHYLLVFPFVAFDMEELLHQRALNSEQIRSHLCDLFSALSHIHSKGIIHRDIKPSNLLLVSPLGPAYLADFGVAWMDGDEASEPADKKITDVGTTCYRPPELLFGHAGYNSSLDLWAAGCIVAQVVSEGYKTLFDAGPLGSELALIQSIFKTLGTPTRETWPEVVGFSDWGKMDFYKFPQIPWSTVLPKASKDALSLVDKLVRYQSSNRMTADIVLKHDFFKDVT